MLNRLASVTLPAGVNPQISPASPIGEILRYTITNPPDPITGKPLYTLSDLKAVQDYVLQRERVRRVAGVTGIGGTVKRYEIQPDPDRPRQYGVSLDPLQTAIGSANANGSGDNLTQGQLAIVVRSLGLFGNGRDPQQATLAMTDPQAAAAFLRGEEARRCLEIRQVVVAGHGDAARFEVLRKMGFDDLIDFAGTGMEVGLAPYLEDGKFDVVIEATGAGAVIKPAMAALKTHGVLVITGIHAAPVPIDLTALVRQHQQLRGSYRAAESAWPEVVDFMRGHQESLRHMITHRVPLSGAYEGFALARSKVDTKVMVQPELDAAQ